MPHVTSWTVPLDERVSPQLGDGAEPLEAQF
jgi:hypothetical protein